MNRCISRKIRALVATVLATIGAVLTQAAETSSPALPGVQVLATDPTALEGTSSGAFTLIRSGSFSAALSVNFALSGSASNGVDYVSVKNTVTIPAGLAAADVVIVPIVNPKNTGNKKVTLTLATNASYRLQDHKSATVSIVDDAYDNQPPTVTLTSPTNNSVFAYPATIPLRAEAGDSDGTIAKVSFFADDDFLGEATTSPFTLVWTNAHTGKYAVFARATDVLGKSTLSSAAHITVTNFAPVVTLVSPATGAVFGVRSNVKLEAQASARNGSITKVQFYGDNRFLGSVTNQPYSLTWSNVPPGRHTVSARAIDSAGTTVSATGQFTVTNASPTVSITSPADGASFARGTNITVKATAADSDGAISSVSFYASRRFLGRVTKSPYEFIWKNATAGVQSLTAVATDEYGESTTSKAVSVTVK